MTKTFLISVNIREIPEMNSHIYSPLINEKDNAAVQWERMIFSINGIELLDVCFKTTTTKQWAFIHISYWQHTIKLASNELEISMRLNNNIT